MHVNDAEKMSTYAKEISITQYFIKNTDFFFLGSCCANIYIVLKVSHNDVNSCIGYAYYNMNHCTCLKTLQYT